MTTSSSSTVLRCAFVCLAALASGPALAVDLHVQDFESGPGSLFTSGANSTWSYGQPTSGPLAAQSGLNCWATGLGGSYANDEDSYLTSGPIDLSANSGGPFLFSWWQYMETEADFDAGSLEISIDGGVTWQRVYGEASGAVASVWTRQFVLLDASAAVAGFRYRFHLRSDASNSADGYYIDTVRIASRETGQVYFEDFEAGDGGYVPEGSNSTWDYGTPTSGPGQASSGTMAWGTELDAYYAPYEDSALVSPPIDLSAYAGKAFVVSWRQHLTTEADFDLAKVQVRSGSAAAWTTAYGEVSGVVSDVWMRQSILVGPEMATSGFQLRFALMADGFFENSGFYIDDVEVRTLEGGVMPAVTWDPPASIESGTPLDGTQLDASTPVSGSFSYSPPAGTVLGPGSGQLLTATFSPDDLLTYSPVVTSVAIDVTGGISYESEVVFPPGTPVADTLPEADYDNDGGTNFYEYAFVTDVLGGDDLLKPHLVIIPDAGSSYAGIEFSVRSNDPALLYAFQTSTDVELWDSHPLSFGGGVWSVDGGGVVVLHSAVETSPDVWRLQIRDVVPLGGVPRFFLRLVVTR